MTRAKEQYENLYEIAGAIDEPAFDVLEHFIEESEETDPLALTDEFVENNDRPYITRSELLEEFDLSEDELDQALDELTGRTEGRGYLESNGHTRRSDFHEPHDNFGHRTDGDIQRITEYKRRIDEESPDELSFRLGQKVEELEEMIPILEANPKAGKAYLFISEHEDRDAVDHGYPETEGVSLSAIEDELGREAADSLSTLHPSYGSDVSAVRKNRISSKALHDRAEGEPSQSRLQGALTKIGLSSEYDEADLEPYEGDASVLYRTATRDFDRDTDHVRDRLVEHLIR